MYIRGSAELWQNQLRVGLSSQSADYQLLPGGSVIETIPYPSLRGTLQGAGTQTIGIEIDAGIGTSRRIIAGRRPVLAPIAGLTIGRLVTTDRLASLGASNNESEQMTLFSAQLPIGTVVNAQISATRASGRTELSNSISLVIR